MSDTDESVLRSIAEETLEVHKTKSEAEDSVAVASNESESEEEVVEKKPRRLML